VGSTTTVTVRSSNEVDALDDEVVGAWLLVDGADDEVGADVMLETLPPAAGVPAVADEHATVNTAVDSRAAAARLCLRLIRSFI